MEVIFLFKVLLKALWVLIVNFFNFFRLPSKKSDCPPEPPPPRLDPATIPKYVNQLPKPPIYAPIVVKSPWSKKVLKHVYFVDASEFKQQILPPGFPETKVFGYGGVVKDPETGRTRYSRSTPGATFEAVRGIPASVKWINRLNKPHFLPVDPTLHWANPNNMPMNPPKPWPPFPPGFKKAQWPVPMVTHLHGGETPSIYDGHPDAWFTFNGVVGPAYVTSWYTYPNQQEPTTLFYHDHSLGITRLNVYAGLEGFYLLRDDKECREDTGSPQKLELPEGKFEIPIAIQDRSFYEDGSLFFPTVGNNPDIHPYWVPEFIGDTITVNGKVWPNLNVERRQYRFRIVNASNARFYNLFFSNNQTFTQIGSDGGFLPHPVELQSLLIAPGERADILVDFSNVTPGTSILLLNDAPAPFPGGETPNHETVGQIMQFTVPANAAPPVHPNALPNTLNKIPNLVPNRPDRVLSLHEVMGPNGPVELLLNGMKWSATITELPVVGSTEDWVVANLTADTHPIHLHLVQFLPISRQPFDADAYMAEWERVNGTPPLPLDQPYIPVPIEPYLTGPPIPPDPNEQGWKDTVRMNPGEVTRIRVRFAPQDVSVGAAKPGVNLYPFDPTFGPGYVWHCHILDHEDNEMMRPYRVVD